MTIKELISYSMDSQSFCEAYSIVNANALICGTHKLQGRSKNDMKPEVLYVVSYDELPKALPGRETYNFLILVPDKDMRFEIPDVIRTRCNLLLSDSSAERALIEMQNIIFDGWKIESSMRLLTEALLASGIKEMLEIGAEQMDCRIMLVEQSGKIIEKSAGNRPMETEGPFVDYWNREDMTELMERIEEGYYPKEEVQEYVRFHDMDIFHMEEIARKVIARPIRVSRIEMGKLIAFFDKEELTVLDGELLHRMCLLVGEELQKLAIFKTGHRQRYLNFMWMLLEDKYPNPKTIERAMEELNIEFKGKCCVSVIHVVAEQENSPVVSDMLNLLSTQIDSKMPDVLWLIYNDELVLLFNLDKNEEIPEYALALLKGLSAKNELSIGISASFDAMVGVRQLYWQAQQAAEYGYEYLHQKFTFFKDVSHFSLLRLIQSNIDPMVFVDPDLLKLFKSEKENYQEYFTTLYYYLKYSGNTSAVAAKTHMHRNTVLYRIDKLQQLMNFDLSDGVATMKLVLSFEILKYLKLIKFDE